MFEARFSNTKVYILNHYFILPTLFHTLLYLLVVVNIAGVTTATDSFYQGFLFYETLLFLPPTDEIFCLKSLIRHNSLPAQSQTAPCSLLWLEKLRHFRPSWQRDRGPVALSGH